MRAIEIKGTKIVAVISSNSFGDQIIHITDWTYGKELILAHVENQEGSWVDITQKYLKSLIGPEVIKAHKKFNKEIGVL